jgi:hypothetical protein
MAWCVAQGFIVLLQPVFCFLSFYRICLRAALRRAGLLRQREVQVLQMDVLVAVPVVPVVIVVNALVIPVHEHVSAQELLPVRRLGRVQRMPEGQPGPDEIGPVKMPCPLGRAKHLPCAQPFAMAFHGCASSLSS